jgi:hypothetical protein
MGYLDGLVDSSFKKDAEGRTVFYPWGTLGSGYIVETGDLRNQIRSLYKTVLIVLIPTTVLFQITVGWWLNLVLVPFCVIGCYFWVRNLTKGLPKSTEKLTTAEAYKNSARSYNLTLLIGLEFLSVIFVTTGFLLLLNGGDRFVALASIVFFGFCGATIGCLITAKIRSK